VSARRLTFLREFLRRPRQLGTMVPSSSFLESRLLRMGDVTQAKVVLELGPGTGGTTEAILRALPRDASLLTIEINPHFAAALRSRTDPRLLVHLGSAEQLSAAIRNFELPAPDVVISGIPFSSISRVVARRILRSIWSCLAPSGRFVAYQFRREIEKLGRGILGRAESEFELLNVPPLHVYRWRKPDAVSVRTFGGALLAGESGSQGVDAMAHGAPCEFRHDCRVPKW
jgi:phosphatidylethanolamine/phosphatidyl-N-methylethanolamine N-methyltransferase